jgi:hypothetical protein
MQIRMKVLNSPIFDHILRLADGSGLELAFAAVDILLQCLVQNDVRAQLGPSRGQSITAVLQKLLFGHDFGLAVLASKGLIATLEINTPKLQKHIAMNGPMTFRRAVRMVVLMRVFTRVHRRKDKTTKKKSEQQRLAKTMRVI